MSNWDPSKHPRDEEGKFTEGDSVGFTSQFGSKSEGKIKFINKDGSAGVLTNQGKFVTVKVSDLRKVDSDVGLPSHIAARDRAAGGLTIHPAGSPRSSGFRHTTPAQERDIAKAQANTRATGSVSKGDFARISAAISKDLDEALSKVNVKPKRSK